MFVFESFLSMYLEKEKNEKIDEYFYYLCDSLNIDYTEFTPKVKSFKTLKGSIENGNSVEFIMPDSALVLKISKCIGLINFELLDSSSEENNLILSVSKAYDKKVYLQMINFKDLDGVLIGNVNRDDLTFDFKYYDSESLQFADSNDDYLKLDEISVFPDEHKSGVLVNDKEFTDIVIKYIKKYNTKKDEQ